MNKNKLQSISRQLEGKKLTLTIKVNGKIIENRISSIEEYNKLFSNVKDREIGNPRVIYCYTEIGRIPLGIGSINNGVKTIKIFSIK